MQIVLNHLTRMRGASICVAGIDLEGGRHVRPVQRGNLTRTMLTSSGGPFALGATIEVAAAVEAPDPPHVEDHRFNAVTQVAAPSAEALRAALTRVERQTLRDIFGDPLHIAGTSATMERGQGLASLGVLRVAFNDGQLFENRWGKLRLRLNMDGANLDLGVTDLRLYDAQGQIRRAQIDAVNALLPGARGWIAVGLARAFTSADNVDHPCYLQVNNVFPAQDPLWGTR